ncbi:hypothetical protein [Microvirga sp. M2]
MAWTSIKAEQEHIVEAHLSVNGVYRWSGEEHAIRMSRSTGTASGVPA